MSPNILQSVAAAAQGGSRKKYLREGAWPLIIWEATTAKQNYYRTNYIKHVEKLGLNYPEKIWARFRGACAPSGPNIEPPVVQPLDIK